MRMFAFPILLASMLVSILGFSGPVSARDVKYVKSAEYTCQAETDNTYFKPNGDYRLKFKTLTSNKGEELRIENAAAKFITAIKSPHDIAFLIQDENMYRKTSLRGYLMFDPTEQGGKTPPLTIASQESKGSYSNDRLNCELVGRLDVGTIKVQTIECTTAKPLPSTGKIHTLKFGLAGADDPTHLTLTTSVRISPRNSILSSLNENQTVGTNADRVRIFGDSAGIDFAEILLSKASGLTKGTLTLESSGKKYGTVDLNCTVK